MTADFYESGHMQIGNLYLTLPYYPDMEDTDNGFHGNMYDYYKTGDVDFWSEDLANYDTEDALKQLLKDGILKDEYSEINDIKAFSVEGYPAVSCKYIQNWDTDLDTQDYLDDICGKRASTVHAAVLYCEGTVYFLTEDMTFLSDELQDIAFQEALDSFTIVEDAESDEETQEPELNLRKVYEFATTTPLDELRFILETKRLNKAAAERSFQGNYGHQLGKILKNSKSEEQLLGSNTFSHILSYTSAACDARMAGAMIPVMSNSGSGNQGISATLPVVVFAEENNKSEEELIRALMLSHLTVIYIKQSLGRLSALCGCVVAATGSSCGITWLMGGSYDQVTFAVQNMIANLTGMICDGAKPSCALKVTTGVSTAVLSAMMAMENRCVTSVEGIIDEDVDQSIRNLTRIGSQAMNETDKMVLDIMTHKGC